MGRFALILMAFAAPLSAEIWVALDGDGIRAALTDQKFVYPEKQVQEFYASGRTLYTTSRPSWGYWEVRGDQYCSQWPPSDLWACYDMAAQGDKVRFIGALGDTSDATLVLAP